MPKEKAGFTTVEIIQLIIILPNTFSIKFITTAEIISAEVISRRIWWQWLGWWRWNHSAMKTEHHWSKEFFKAAVNATKL